MVTRVSTFGSLQADLFLIRRQNLNFDRLNFQVSTGEKFQELKNYGTKAPRILDLQSEIDRREGYVNSLGLSELNLQSYDATLERLGDIIDDIIKASEPLSTQDPNFTSTTETLATNLLIEVDANLNLEIGDRFLFAGTRFDTAPVANLRALPVYTTNDLGVANTVETANDIPTFIVDSGGANTAVSYHTQGPNTQDARSYEQVGLTVTDDALLTYGITATDPAFQNLIESIVRLRSSAQAGLTEAEREQFLAEASTVAQTARDQIRQLQATNGLNLARIQDQKENHENFINISKIALDDIKLVDDATAAAEISALSAQVQASFTVISTRRQLSLVNFL